MSIHITDLREVTKPIASPIRNAYIDFSKMTISLVALMTDVVRNAHPVVGYGFNSNGRYGQGGLIRERFASRLREADPQTLLDETGENFDPDRVWAVLMANEKPGGTQPDSLWRHAFRPRLAAVRLRTLVRLVRIPAHARSPADARVVAHIFRSRWQTAIRSRAMQEG